MFPEFDFSMFDPAAMMGTNPAMAPLPLGAMPQPIVAPQPVLPAAPTMMPAPSPTSGVPMAQDQALGEAIGAPMDITSAAQKASLAGQAPAGPGMAERLAGALKGVKAPPGPEMPRVSTPNAPSPRGQIKGGQLAQLLLAAGQGGGGGAPMALNSAIRR